MLNNNDGLDLRHFEPSEFREWWGRMSDQLLLGLDAFREALGERVIISPSPFALGRKLGNFSDSQHNFDMYGEVRAVDVMSPAPLDKMYQVARELELFGGIGVYPDWRPHHGLHLDMRAGRENDNPATWAGLVSAEGQVYVGVQNGLDRWAWKQNARS